MQRKRATMKARCLNIRGCRTLWVNTALGLLPALVFSANIASLAEPGITTPGCLVVERLGDGSALLNNSATPVFLDVFTPGGTPGAPYPNQLPAQPQLRLT